MRIYLDHNATAPLLDEARAAMAVAAATAGNPSSIHAEGRAARALVDDARARVAAMVGGSPDEIVFTSGGTEADLLGVIGLARGSAPRVITTAIEHPAVAGACEALRAEGFAIEHARTDRDGRIDLDDLDARAADGGAVIAIAAANHELGTVQEIDAIAAIARAHGWRLVVDAVQAAGRAPLAPIAHAADAVAISAHKLGGPAGVGALWVRRGIDVAPLVPGGHQERGRRAGTENVIGIAGFGAVASFDPERAARVRALTARLEAGLLAIGLHVRAQHAPRIGNTINARASGALGESIVIALDLAGVAASTGAACTSGSVKPSPVLLGLGEDERTAREAVRFSLGASNTDADVDAVLAMLPAIVARATTSRA
jgi:cysteine desulfurase